jgi:lipopolysaccharide/colanic/teichoic acid biosynthesis glycosyltransferase
MNDPDPRLSAARRAIDLIVSLACITVLSPAVFAVGLLILLTSGRPILFRQQRVGQGGVPFTMYKFRTMRPSKTTLELTAPGDGRITRLGRILRRTSLDEIPQLFNVLRGDMTLVGPRPEALNLAKRYPEEARAVLAARPGMTGPAQIRLRDSTVIPAGVADIEEFYLREIVPARARIDLEYLRDPSVACTVRVLLETAVHIAIPGRTFKPFRVPADASRSGRNGH